MNINKVFLAGRLTRDPEQRFTPKGTTVCNFGLATNRAWNDGEGNKHEEPFFVDVTAFGKTAETIAKHLSKGREIFIEGRLDLDEWKDKETGKNRRQVKVIANHFQFVGRKPDSTAVDSEN